MYLSRAVELSYARRDVETSPEGDEEDQPWSRGFSFFTCCVSFVASKMHLWCLLSVMVLFSVVTVGGFEAVRLSNHIMRSPCTVLDAEVIDVGTCKLCDYGDPKDCKSFPISTARLRVTFQPEDYDQNVSGFVWYCKGRVTTDPCERDLHFMDQFVLDYWENLRLVGNTPLPCTSDEVHHYLDMHGIGSGPADVSCYYSSRDPGGEDVWLSMPTPALVTQSWLQKHSRFPILWAVGGLVLLSVLLSCFALEGTELGTSGLMV